MMKGLKHVGIEVGSEHVGPRAGCRSPPHIALQLPAISEFSTNEVMGHSGDRLAAAFGISRKDQDEYACRSHNLAHQAAQGGKLQDLLTVFAPGESLSVPPSMQ